MLDLNPDLNGLQLTQPTPTPPPGVIARERFCYCFDLTGDNPLCPTHGPRVDIGRPLEIVRLSDAERKVRLWFRFPCDGCGQEQATARVRWEHRTEFLCPACKRIMLHLVYGPGYDRPEGGAS